MKTHTNPGVSKHLEAIPLAMSGDPKPSLDPRQPPSATCPPSSCRSALKGSVKRHRVDGIEGDVDLPSFLKRQAHKDILKEAVSRQKSIKFWISVNVKLIRPKNWLTRGDQESFPYFTSRCSRVLQVTDIDLLLETAYTKISEDFAKWLKEGSGWIIDHVNFVDLVVITYKPLKGSSYIKLPPKIYDTKSCINVQNDDQKCFLWAILSALHSVDEHAHRVTKYIPFEQSLNMGNIKYPVAPDSIPKFEKLNGLTINLFGFEGKDVFPIYISDGVSPAINLLLISNGRTQHYVWIKDFSRLMCCNTKHNGRAFYCLYCLHRFSTQHMLSEHMDSCRKHGPQKITMPTDEERFLKFKNGAHMMPVPYVIYADFESTISEIDQKAGKNTTRTAEHKPASFCYVVVGREGNLLQPPFLYRGEDCAKVFLQQMKKEELKITDILKMNISMDLSEEEEEDFQSATCCHICKKELGEDRHRDHCHLSGVYRGASHPGCNLNYKTKSFIPVILHNLKGYDSHLIMQAIGQFKDSKIDCIANNYEKYISFSLDKLRFIDSLQFMSESLEKLTANLVRSGRENFKLMKEVFPDNQLDYVLAKGNFPYEYFNSLDRLKETQLPPQSAFWSTLTDSGISDDDYRHAQDVWAAFKMTTFGDYHDLYLKTDVLLLADVFQSFRTVCKKCYGLDPCHYFTAPGLAWDAALKKSDVTLELLTDPDMHLFVEEGTRGGISMISNRHAKANNINLPDYNASKPASHIMYLDANNLYGWAMSQSLPVSNFKWVDHSIDVTTIPDDGVKGYILEVDLTYPESLHDSHSDYPLAPESMVITDEMLSPYSMDLLQELGMTHSSTTKKLVPNLKNKKNYILHYRNLKFYLEQGMILTKVHKVLEFHQAPWLKTYIDFNTAQRTIAQNEFEKNFFKLMNNAVFGKTMENLRKRRNVKLVHTKDWFEKLSCRPTFESCKIFNEDLLGVELLKTTLKLNRPIYVGFSVLDLSKILMYKFYYGTLKKMYGDNVKLLFTDTDSLTVQIFTDDVYQDMKSFQDQLDTSDYPQNHPLYSSINKKVIGKMKDELNSVPIVSYVGLRAKMYSIQPLEGDTKKTAKGVNRSVVKRKFQHADYERVLFHRQPKVATMTRIQSDCHHLYSLQLNKLGLSAADDKRYVLEDGCDTLAHGHYRIQRPPTCE